jgi:hypothetical protein
MQAGLSVVNPVCLVVKQTWWEATAQIAACLQADVQAATAPISSISSLLMCATGATEQEVHDAARSANAHNFISALPAGYQTQVRYLVKHCTHPAVSLLQPTCM